MPLLAENHTAVALVTVVVGLTFVTIVFGELVPKRLALGNAETVARWVALPIAALLFIARPAIWIMEIVFQASCSGCWVAARPKKRRFRSKTSST